MKSYTDVQQSQALAGILQIESADMWYQYIGDSFKDGITKPIYFPMVMRDDQTEKDIPAWSLNALLNVLPSSTLDSSDDHHYRVHCRDRFTEWHDNAVDACVEMILKLREQMIDDFNKEE